jgi:hypothetical protein
MNMAGDQASAQTQLSKSNLNLGDYNNNFNYQLNQNQLSNELAANATNTNNAYNTVGADYNRQTQAAGANYTSSLGANQAGLASALAQIAASQHGVLSSLGGIQTPAPAGGGGINWNGVSGLLSNAVQVFGNGSNGNRSNSPYSVGTQYGSYNQTPAGNYSNTTGAQQQYSGFGTYNGSNPFGGR